MQMADGWVGAGIAGLLLWWAVRRALHALILWGLRAPRVIHDLPQTLASQGGRAVRIATANGKHLFGWFTPVPGRCAAAVVVMHGWGANAAMMQGCIAPLVQAGYAVLLVDARCHGLSDSEPFTSLPRFAQDIDAAVDWMAGQPEVQAGALALIGHSVGAGAALLCASRRTDIGGVISISAFAHPATVMRLYLRSHHLPYCCVGWYLFAHVQKVIGARFDDIAPLRSVARVTCPVLLVHGTQDETVPFDDALQLQAASANPRTRLLAVPGDHDPSDALLQDAAPMIEFLQDCLAGTGRAKA